jgi:hypothetical protein
MNRSMILLIALLFLAFIAVQWMTVQSQRRSPKGWGLERRRNLRLRAKQRAQGERPEPLRPAPSPGLSFPLPMVAGFVMTVIAIALLLAN